MDKIKLNENKRELTEQQKRIIDFFINGVFMLFGAALFVGVLNSEQMRLGMGLLSFYIGSKFFPR